MNSEQGGGGYNSSTETNGDTTGENVAQSGAVLGAKARPWSKPTISNILGEISSGPVRPNAPESTTYSPPS